MKLIWTEGAISDWEGIARYIAVNFGKKIYDEYDEATIKAEKQDIRVSRERHTYEDAQAYGFGA